MIQLGVIVNALHVIGIICLDCPDGATFAKRHADNVGHQVFLLVVVPGGLLQPTHKVAGTGNHHARVDFTNLLLLGGCVALLDNCCGFAIRVPDETSVSPGVRYVYRQYPEIAGFSGKSDERFSR